MKQWDENLKEGFQLHEHSVHPSRNVIISPDGEQHIEPKAMRVLLFLASQPNRVISRQNFMEQVWPDTITGEEVLTRCISLLRSALGKNNEHNYIETVTKSGYRLVAPVKHLSISEDDEADNKSRWIPVRIVGGLALFTIAIFIAVAGYKYRTIDEETTEIIPSIAVLPFINMSSDPEQEYFSDGISEEILNVLAKIPNLHVTSRSSTFAFKGKNINVNEFAKKLGVSNVLEGSVRKSGTKLRITAQLIDVETDTHLWSETYDRELTDIFSIQDEISAEIVQALKIKLGLDVKIASRDIMDVNLDAHNEYLQGRFFIEKRTREAIGKALSHFNKAIELAPEYAPAWMGKAWATMFLRHHITSDEITYEGALTAIKKALLLDPELPEAHAIMGLIVSYESHDKAIPHYERAIELKPNYADAYMWLSISNQDIKKDLELVERAVKLNPMSLIVNYNYCILLISFGRFEEAREVATHMLSINTSHAFPYAILGKIQQIEGNYAASALSFSTITAISDSNVKYKSSTANTLSAIGLLEQASRIFEDSDFAELKYWYSGNTELYISQSRVLYPRTKDDSFGLFLRALAEVRAENYSEAVKYFKLTKLLETDIGRIYSYFRVGETVAAQALLDKRKAILSSRIDAEVEYWGGVPIEVNVMRIAYLEGDIQKAMANLKQAMDKKYIIDYDYKVEPMYKKLREHPDWPALLAESERRATIQREIYMKLVAEKDKSSL